MKYLVLHHSAVFNNGWSQLYGVNKYHKNKWNMKSSLGWYVGYNFFCDVNGKRTQTRALDEEQMAQVGSNCNTKERCTAISYCMAGDFRYQLPTDKQKQNFIKFVDEMRLIYYDIKVVGHRDLQAERTCPELSKEYIDQFNKELDPIDAEKSIETKRLQNKIVDLTKIVISLLQARVKQLLKQLGL